MGQGYAGIRERTRGEPVNRGGDRSSRLLCDVERDLALCSSLGKSLSLLLRALFVALQTGQPGVYNSA